MKPPRRLGKGLADMVGLHAGTIVTSAPAEEIDDGEAAPASVLHLLSTEAEGLPGPRVVKASAPPVTPAAAPAPPASVAEPAPTPAREPEPEPEPVEAAPPPVVVAPVMPEPVVEAVVDTVPLAPEPVVVAQPSEPAPVSAVELPVVETVEAGAPEPEPEPEVASGAFEDEWFDPPISAFSPAGGFHRVQQEYDAPVPEPSLQPTPEPAPVARAIPEVVRETPPETLPDLSALPPAPSRIASIPEEPVEERPEPQSGPQPEPVLDDPVIVDDGLFFDDVVVGNFLPDVDLDS